MSKALQIFLGVLTAIGGFVDIGELVAGSAAGARFEMRLAWATVLSMLGIVLFAEMSGRVTALSQRPAFDLIREHSDRVEMHIFNHVGHFHFREIPDEWNQVVMTFLGSCK